MINPDISTHTSNGPDTVTHTNNGILDKNKLSCGTIWKSVCLAPSGKTDCTGAIDADGSCGENNISGNDVGQHVD